MHLHFRLLLCEHVLLNLIVMARLQGSSERRPARLRAYTVVPDRPTHSRKALR